MRQLPIEGNVVTLDDDLLAGRLRAVNDLRCMPARRVGEHLGVMQLGLAPVAKADGHGRALAGAEGVEQDGHALGVHRIDVVEHQRRAVLAAHVMHQGLQFVAVATAIERHVDLLQLSLAVEHREKLAHVLVRHRRPLFA